MGNSEREPGERQGGWSEGEEWSIKKKCRKAEDKGDFVTFAMLSVKHSVAHRPQIGQCVKSDKETERLKDIGTARLIHFHSHRRYHGTKCVETAKL